MKAYISVSFSQRSEINKIVNAIERTLMLLGIKPFVFIDNYSFDKTQEKEMMSCAFGHIANADSLIAEVSDKAIGIGVEVGYARAIGIPAIYLRNTIAEHSTTVSGACNYCIIYWDETDLKQQLENLIMSIYPLPKKP